MSDHPDSGREQLGVTAARVALAEANPSWVPHTLGQHVHEIAQRYSTAPYVIGESRTYTYREMLAESRRIAGGLLRAGVQPGDHVAMIIANQPEFVSVKFAIAIVGAVAVPLNFRLRAAELAYCLHQSDSVALVTMDRFAEHDYLADLNEVAPGWRTGRSDALPKLRVVVVAGVSGHAVPGDLTSLEQLAEGPVPDRQLDELVAGGDPDAIADIMYTSGTTGMPKGVMLTHDANLRSAAASAFTRAIRPGQRILFSLPLYHVFAYIEGLLAVSFAGGAVVPQLVFSPEPTFDAIARHGVEEVLFVPTMTVAALEHPSRADYDTSSLRGVMSASAPAPLRLWTRLRDEWGAREIVTGYGQTETAAASTYTLPDGPLELVASTVGKAKFGYVAGVPELDGAVTVYRTQDPITGEVLPDGAEGELAIYGPQVMRGYYHKPDETAAVLGDDGWMRSGDLGSIDVNGYLNLTGRTKELYKRGGELVAPREIEELLTARPDVQQAYAVGIPDDRWGEVGWVFVIPERAGDLDEAAVLDYCQTNLARFKVPERAVFLAADDLPTTATGKVQKHRLVERVVSGKAQR